MAGLTGRKLIASRCAKFFKDGDFVNLGIGVPLMCVNYLPEGVDLWLEAEIGTVGSGPTPSWDEADIDVIDAGGQPASVIKDGARNGWCHGSVCRSEEDHRSNRPL